MGPDRGINRNVGPIDCTPAYILDRYRVASAESSSQKKEKEKEKEKYWI
jgi:hypothetical protein